MYDCYYSSHRLNFTDTFVDASITSVNGYSIVSIGTIKLVNHLCSQQNWYYTEKKFEISVIVS